jgi:predicted ester cyclase
MSLDESLERNKALVRRYFDEVLDAKRTEVVYELFAPDCRVQFPHEPEPRLGVETVYASLEAASARQSSMVSHLEHIIAEGDLVAVRLRHDVTFNTIIPTRNGTLDATGKSVSWVAHVFFRVRDGKIVEEWVQRDEAGILQQLGGLPAPSA